MKRRRLTTFVMCGAADHKAQTWEHRLPPDASDQEREAYMLGWTAAARDELEAIRKAVRNVR